MAYNDPLVTSSYESLSYTFSFTSSQDTNTNRSTISWKLTSTCTNGWTAERTLILTAAGNTLFSKSDRVQRGTTTSDNPIASGSFAVNHDSNGNASFSVNIQAAVYTSSISINSSKTFTLPQIPRKSTLSVGNGTLGTQQTLRVTTLSDSFTHTITYSCGSATGTIGSEKTKSKELTFTPSYDLAEQKKIASSMNITYTITTYNGNTAIGSNSYTKTLTIPNNSYTKPTVESITVSDPTGYLATYGAYVKGKSTFKVVTVGKGQYKATISAYSVWANKSTSAYTSGDITTGVCNTVGTYSPAVASVKDSRGFWSDSVNAANVTVLDYSKPSISISVKRVTDSTGNTEDIQGGWCKVSYTYKVTALNNHNKKELTLQYKKKSETTYCDPITIDLSDKSYEGSGSQVFKADDGSSYDVKMELTDDFTTTPKSTSLSTAFAIMHFNASGKGIALGRISTEDKLQVGMDSVFDNPVSITSANSDHILKIVGSNGRAYPTIDLIPPESESTTRGFVQHGYGYTYLYANNDSSGADGRVIRVDCVSDFENSFRIAKRVDSVNTWYKIFGAHNALQDIDTKYTQLASCANNTATNAFTISLTPGVWFINFVAHFSTGSTTTGYRAAHITSSSASGSWESGLSIGDWGPGGACDEILQAVGIIKVTANTTKYAVVKHTAGAAKAVNCYLKTMQLVKG